MPTLGADNGLALVSMIGADYDDPQWDTLLDQLTFNEMVNTITLGFHNTAAVESIGKTRTKDENGPQGPDRSTDRRRFRYVLHLRRRYGRHLQR